MKEIADQAVLPDTPSFMGAALNLDGEPSSTLRAPTAMRTVWRVLIGMPLVLFFLSIPARYEELVGMARQASAQIGPGPGEGFAEFLARTAHWTPRNGAGEDFLPAFLSNPAYYALGALSLEIIFVLSLVLTSVAIAWSNQAGWRPLFFSAVFVFYPVWVTPTLDALQLPSVLQVVANLTQATGVLLAVTFFLLFPDGRFVPAWTRVSAAAWLLYCLAWGIFPDTWFSLIDPFETSFAAFLILLLLGWGLGLMAQAVRYRQAGQEQRVMTKWVLLVIAGACAGYGIVYMPDVFLPGSGSSRAIYDLFAVPLFWLLALPMPVALALAMQRYHLFDVKVILERTLVYGALTACVIGLYVLVVGGVGALANSSGNLLISLLATGLVAVLFAPLRERLQRGVTRLMYGERDEPYRVLSRLGQRLEAALAPEAVLSTVVTSVSEALKLPYAAIELEQDGAFETAAEVGEPVADIMRLPLLYGGEPVGRLALGRRPNEEDFTPADRRLLEDLARQIGVAVHTTRLADEALRLSEDLQASREQLVTAREEERRRLRRDLHDGLGPQLASLTMKTEAARDLLAVDPDRSDALLQDITAQAQEAVTDVRRLVYGLRPPALDDLGLLGALRAQAAHGEHNGLRVSIQAPDELPPLPAAVEVATPTESSRKP